MNRGDHWPRGRIMKQNHSQTKYPVFTMNGQTTKPNILYSSWPYFIEHDQTVLLALLRTLEPNQIFVARGNQLGTTAVLLPAFATWECCSSHCTMCSSSSANGKSPLFKKSVQFLQKGGIKLDLNIKYINFVLSHFEPKPYTLCLHPSLLS